MGTQEEYSGTVSAPRDQGKEFTWKLILTKHSEGFNRKGFYGKEDQEKCEFGAEWGRRSADRKSWEINATFSLILPDEFCLQQPQKLKGKCGARKIEHQ